MSGAGSVLAIDFGSSNTVAMLRWPDGRSRPLIFDGTPLLPSAVCAPADGPVSIRSLSVGRDALHHGRHRPDGLEPNPKRRIDDGTVLLAARETAVVELIGAVFGRVAHEAVRVGGGSPRALVLSHPAGWGPVRRLALADAAALAGLPAPVFVTEPVAAALCFTAVLGTLARPDEALVVYDLGAGTFDVSVLRAGPSGFEVLGNDGLDDVGGLDVDAEVLRWLQPRYDPTTWARLVTPVTVEDQRLRFDLWTEVRVAKEMLSRAPAALIRPPLLGDEVPLTLEEFEGIVRPLVDRTVRTAVGLARYCGVTPAHVLLVGGSSRIPLVATALHRAFGVAPTVTEQPETVVAEGCLFLAGFPVTAASPVSPVSPGSPGFPVSPPLPAPPPAPATPAPATPTPATSAPATPAPATPAPATSAAVPAPRRPDEVATEPLPVVPAGSMAGPDVAGPGRGPVTPRPVDHPRSQWSQGSPWSQGSQWSQSRSQGFQPRSQSRPAGGDAGGPSTGPAGGAPDGPRPAAVARAQLFERPPPPPVARRGLRTVLWLVGVLALVGALVAAAFTTDVFARKGGRGDTHGTRPPAAGPAGSAPATFPSDWPVGYTDSLKTQRNWSAAALPAESATCTFRDDRFEIEMGKAGIFRCPGQLDDLTDFALTIDVYLLAGLPCAGIWFRRGAHENDKDAGYLLRVCPNEMVVGHHRSDGRIYDFARFPSPPIRENQKAVVNLVMRGGEILLFRAGQFVGRTGNGEYPQGRIALGIAVPSEVGAGHLAFRNVEMRWP